MPTELLLLEDVDDLGRSGQIVYVKPGYARNYLLPQQKAVIADNNARRMQAKLQAERAKKAAVDKEESEKVAAMLNGAVISIEVKVDPDGHMYGSVSGSDIARLIEEKHGHALEKKAVALPHPIKATGVHTIPLRLKEGVAAQIVLKVVPEGGSLQQEPEENPAPDAPSEG